MGILILLVGLAVWWAAHLWRRADPEGRSRFGQPGKGLVAAALVVSILLMIWGYRTASGPVWWGPSPALKGINNLLVLVGIYLFAASGMKTRAGTRLRHPQLIGFSLWAVAHLLVNGDLPSFVLFGGLLLWALVEMATINRAAPGWRPTPVETPARKEVMAVVGAVVVFVVVGLIHGWIGPNPFGA